MTFARRSLENPFLTPNPLHPWEAMATFNGCPVRVGQKIVLLYRALSVPHYHASAQTELMVSDIGRAESRDGTTFIKSERFVVPEEPWERYGCEDPHVTCVGNRCFVFYTALSRYPFQAEGIRVGVAVTDRRLLRVRAKYLVTPFNAKAMVLFPQQMQGKWWVLFTLNPDKPPPSLAFAELERLEDLWDPAYWEKWQAQASPRTLSLLRSNRDHIEVGAPPVPLPEGWLLFYAYIHDYHDPARRLFTVEAVLLDREDPTRIIGQTRAPLLVPEMWYELYGLVPKVVFPSGALLLNQNSVRLYYGAADTTCAAADFDLPTLRTLLTPSRRVLPRFQRAPNNPILEPNPTHQWEAKAVFNPAAIRLGDTTHLLYRALSEDNTSTFGYATTRDGFTINYRHPEPVYVPRAPFEQKRVPNANSGVEDPRLTRFGNTLYMFYTAFDGQNPPRVAFTSISVKDFLNQRWRWAPPTLLTAPECDDKDAFLWPQKVRGKFLIVHRRGIDIDYGFTDALPPKGGWLEETRWIANRVGWWDGKKVGGASPPVKTKKGWIMLYHGVSDDGVYRVGAVLLDKRDPTRILARTVFPLFEPEAPYEKEGVVRNVVFPCGNVLVNDTLFIYYGGGDRVVGVTTIALHDLLVALQPVR